MSATTDIAADRAADGTLAGIGWMVLTTVLFVGVTVIVRHLGSDIPAIQAAFIRYAIGLAMVLPLLRTLASNPPSPRVLGLYGARGLVHGCAVMLWFYAMARVPIAEVTAIGYTAPIYVTLGAALFFGERLHLRRVAAVLIGFLGTIVILRPGVAEITQGHLAQLSAAPLFACSFLIAKGLTSQRGPGEIVGVLSLGCTLTLLPGAILVWRAPTFDEVAWLALTAAIATAGHYTLTRAFRAAPLTVTQPIGFLQLVWAAFLGIILFGEALDPFVLLGGGIVVASVTYISHREAVAARLMTTPPPQAIKH
ncbi:DMT family transporter [Thermohalobaculum xanthum]|uniref:DMT family transporter n=1 Tax=Thermohalobaculum xanthum TaxID=2753746 RepID=UPI001F203913|nr:EamA family transporter [Thermohalobaculum xanthum]